jgi:hypothetical protein
MALCRKEKRNITMNMSDPKTKRITIPVSYFIKNPTKFEEGATVTEMGTAGFV